MKGLLAIAMLASTVAFADDGTAGQSAESGKLNHQEWPSLNELWNETETGDGIKQALVNSTLGLDLLVGYEYSDLDGNGTDPANALLTRTRLNYQSGEYKDFSGFVQAQYVGPINDRFDPKDPAYDTVADPEAFRFHQAYLN